MHEDKTLQFQDLDQIFQNAHLRRSAELGGWLRDYFATRRPRMEEEAKLLNTTTTLHRHAV